VIGAVVLATRGGGTSIGPLPLNSVGAIDPRRQARRVDPGRQDAVALAYGSARSGSPNQDDGTVMRIDPRSRKVSARSD